MEDKIKLGRREVELKFTYNSMLYLENFNFGDIDKIDEGYVFKMFSMTRELLFGAVNNNPRKKFTLDDVDKYLSKFEEDDGDIKELFELLFDKLESSNFFKKLQQEEA